MNDEDWAMMDFSGMDYLCLPTFEDDLFLDVGMTESCCFNRQPEFDLDLETLAEFPDDLPSTETPFLKQPKIQPEPEPILSMSETEPQPIAPILERSVSPDLHAPITMSTENEYSDYHDHIVRSLSIDQLKAVVSAYHLARWKNDLQLGCQAWLEKNPSASEAEAKAVKTLLNPTHWKHTWLIIAAANEIVQSFSSAPKSKGRRSSIHNIGIRASDA